MKKLLSVLLSMMMLVTSVVLPIEASAESSITTVDLTNAYQTMNGFGASACWWSQDVGGWENINDIMSLLYSKDNGIGLNIYRYNLGAGSKNDAVNYTEGRDTECFLTADGTYNWSNDANAQTALASAKGFAGDNLRVTLFCNSAPIYMTKNGKAVCSEPNVSNLDSSRYGDFADFTMNCANYFLNSGYRVTDISPINEPCYTWTAWDWEDLAIYAGQEGCYFHETDARELFKVFIDKFNNSDLKSRGCYVSLFEASETGTDPSEEVNTPLEYYLDCLFSSVGSNGLNNSDIRKNIDTIGMHSYWTSAEGKQNTANLLNGKGFNGKYKVAQTEYCQMEADIYTGVYDLVNGKMSSGLTMPYGLALANVIYDDLTILNAVEWDWWTACAYGGYTDGLVYLDKNTHQIETSKRLYTLGNFSKFTDEGSVRVASDTSDELKTVAFKNTDGTISIVFINNNSVSKQTQLNINGLTSSCYSFKSYVTDDTSNLAEYQNGTSNDATVTLPADSVTTVVVNPQHIYDGGVVTPASCTADGNITYTCTVCGDVMTQVIPALSHSFGNNAQLCSVCGAVNPNYVAPQPVTEPTTTPTTAPTTTPTTQATPTGATKVGSEWIAPKQKNAKVSKLAKAKKSFKATWSKVSGVAGYQVQYATDKNFKKNKKTVTISKNKTTSTTVKKLKAKQKYYVRIRTYKNVKLNGKTVKVYSKWSSAKTVTTK